MRTIAIVAISALGLAVAGCRGISGGAAVGRDPHGADARAIERALNDWVEAYNHQEWMRTLELWEPTAIVSTPRGDVRYDELRAANVNRAVESRPSRSYRVEVDEIEVSGDLAYVRDSWYLTTLDAATGKTTTSKQRSLEVWGRNPDGRWRVVRAAILPEEPSPVAPSSERR